MSDAIRVRRALILANPVARGFSQRKIDTIAHALAQAGVAVETLLSRKAGDIQAFACENCGRVDAIAVHGGDGSINEAVAGLLQAGGPRPALAIVAGGTANVLAREIGGGFDAAQIARAIVAGRTAPLHYGLANGRPFVLMASAGFDAAVVHRMRPGLKRAIGKWAYIAAAFAQLRSPRPPDVTVRVAERTIPCRIAICANAARYGGDFVIAPQTAATQPGLRLVAVTDDSLAGLLRIGWRLVRGRDLAGAGVVSLAADAIEIAEGAPAQLDGDAFGLAPLRIEAGAAPLRLIVG